MTPANVYQVIKKLERPEAVGATTTAPAAIPQSVPPSAVTGAQSARKEVRKNASPAVAAPEPLRYTGDMVVEKFEGKGIGRTTLAAICQELNLDCARIKQKLAAGQMAVKDDETLKDASARQGVVPIEVLKIIRVGEPI